MQAVGLAEALARALAHKRNVKIDNLTLRQVQPWVSLPPAVIPDGISGLNRQDRRHLLAMPVADFIISCGRQMVAPALFLKKIGLKQRALSIFCIPVWA